MAARGRPRSDAPHGCMVVLLVLAAPTGAVENHPVREFLADAPRDVQNAIALRLLRGLADGDIDMTTSSERLHSVARYYTTVVQGLSIHARDGASRTDLEAVIDCSMAAWGDAHVGLISAVAEEPGRRARSKSLAEEPPQRVTSIAQYRSCGRPQPPPPSTD